MRSVPLGEMRRVSATRFHRESQRSRAVRRMPHFAHQTSHVAMSAKITRQLNVADTCRCDGNRLVAINAWGQCDVHTAVFLPHRPQIFVWDLLNMHSIASPCTKESHRRVNPDRESSSSVRATTTTCVRDTRVVDARGYCGPLTCP